MSNAASKIGISSFLLTNTDRNAPRKSSSFLMSMNVSARVASVSRRGPASRPASWSSRANAPSRGNRSASGTSRLLDQGGHLLADALEVFLVFERRSERRVDQRRVDASGAERGQRSGPVQRLRHSRHLVELHPPQALHEGGHLAREAVGGLRRPSANDLHLLLEVGVVDPVVETSPLQRVVHLAGPVRGDDDKRRSEEHTS